MSYSFVKLKALAQLDISFISGLHMITIFLIDRIYHRIKYVLFMLWGLTRSYFIDWPMYWFKCHTVRKYHPC